MERDAEQASLATGADPVPNIQVRRLQQDVTVMDQDPADLLGHEESPGTVSGVGN